MESSSKAAALRGSLFERSMLLRKSPLAAVSFSSKTSPICHRICRRISVDARSILRLWGNLTPANSRNECSVAYKRSVDVYVERISDATITGLVNLTVMDLNRSSKAAAQ